MKIYAWTGNKAENGVGSLRYRITTPFTEAAYQGLAEWSYGAGMSAERASGVDVVVGQLLAGPVAGAIWTNIAADPGSPLMVAEYDDDLINVRPDNALFTRRGLDYETYLRQDVPAARAILASSDLVTVSVPHLAELLQGYTDAPVVVLPNTVDPVLLEVPQRTRQPGEQLRVGWGGSATHDIDIRLHADGIRYGLRKTQAKLVMIGTDYRSLLKHPDTELHEWKTRIDEYYLLVHSYHVQLAPLADDAFNRSKSPLKALEAAALGIPVVASDVRPYREFVVHGETGFLCRTEDDWMKAIRTLGNDEELRQAMGRAARQRAAELTTDRWAPTWIQTYREALERKRAAAAV